MSEDFLDDDLDLDEEFEEPIQKPVRRRKPLPRAKTPKKNTNRFDDDYDDIPVRVRKHSRDRDHRREFNFSLPHIEYIALLLLTIIVSICGIKACSTLPKLVVILIVLLVLTMGFLMRKTAVYFSVFLAALILIFGIIFNNPVVVLVGIVPYLATILTFKNR